MSEAKRNPTTKKRAGSGLRALEESVAASSAKFDAVERVIADLRARVVIQDGVVAARDLTIAELRGKIADLEERAEQARVIAAKAFEMRDLEREAGNAGIGRFREAIAERDGGIAARDLVIRQQNEVIAKLKEQIPRPYNPHDPPRPKTPVASAPFPLRMSVTPH